MKHFIIFFLVLLSTGCNLFQGQQPVEENVAVEEKQQQEEVFVPVEKELYVINPKTEIYSTPDTTAKLNLKCELGELVELEAESKHFYKIKSNWDWYLRKEDMGNYEDIRFKEGLEDVYLIGKKQEDGTIEEEKGITLSKYFTIDLISYEEYQKALSNGYFPLVKDTLSIKKERWILTLPCRDTLAEFKDSALKPEADREEYEYLGDMKPIHQYLIAGTYNDSWDKFFIDKRTGHRTEIDSYPYLSPNGKYIITLGETEMGGPTAIALYKVLSKDPFKIELVTVAGIRYWVAYENDKKRPTFFSKDGCLYVAMDLSGSYQYDKPEKPCKYVRIKIK